MNVEELNSERKRQKLSVSELAEKANLPKGTVEKVLFGIVKNPRIDTMQAIEKALGLDSPAITASNIYDVNGLTIFEEIGTVKAGFDGMIDEIPTGRKIEIPTSMLSGGHKDEYFVLRVSGSSMYPRLLDGDTILCKRCSSVDSGSLAVVLYNGDEATVKKVHYVKGEDWLELIPINPEYPVKRFENADLEQCRVLGLVVKLIRDL